MSERLSDERRTGVRAAIDAWEMKGATSTTVALMADALYGAAQEIADAKDEALREAARELPGFPDIFTHGDAARWLRDRADRTDPARNPDRLDATEETP